MSVRIVGIGASAGGLEALESFFANLPTGLGVAFVVVQHLSPDHESLSPAILQRVTPLRVVALREMTVPLPDHVYVRMPEVDVQVDTYALRTLPRSSSLAPHYRPIDDFFRSLAVAQREDAIAILLSGMGTDGSKGLLEIREVGGIVFVQDPDSARFDGMLRASLVDQTPDLLLPPDGLAHRLADLLRSSGGEGADTDLQAGRSGPVACRQLLLDRINEYTRIDFHRYRPGTIMRRIEKRMLVGQFTSLQEYVTHALNNEEELRQLQQSFLIGVTRFFRDQAAFERLDREVLPELFANDESREVRIWVPACSTGEEVYSLGILIHEYLRSNRLVRSFKLFGSDVDRKAIITAANGVYSDAIAADVPQPYLQRYFERTPQGYSVRNELKESVLFAVQNLLEDPPFIRIDLLSCRNFLIYVNGEGQQRVLNNFYFSLNPAGVLVLGPSESLGSLQNAFTTLDRRWKIFRKRQGDSPIDRRRVASPSSPSEKPPPEPVPRTVETAPAPRRPHNTSDQVMDHYARYLSERYAPATLFVDQQYTILYLNGDFDGVLRLPRFNAHLTLQTVVNDEARSLLTAAVDRVLRSGKSGSYERLNVSDNAAPPKYVRVRFSPQEFLQVDHPVVRVEFYPAETDAPADGATGQSEEAYSADRQLREKIEVLENELMRSEQRAQKLYNELEATNEELQSSNRELLASNEEMQSANEELQSVNEELYTVNNEFQLKNEELNNINNDVNNLMKSTQISTIFVDEQLRIRRFTPGVGQQFDLHVTDLGRPITSFSTPFADLDIAALCRSILETNDRYDREIADQNGNYFLLRMLPYITDQERVAGVVITFVDINDLVNTRRQLTDMAQKYAAIFNNTEETIAIMRENSRIEEINRPLAGRDREALVGTYFSDLIEGVEDKVSFNENLRATFSGGEAGQLSLSIVEPNGQKLYLNLQLLPIVPSSVHSSEGEVQRVMVMVHDVTHFEVERQASNAIIDQYKKTLSFLQQDAGLINLDEQLILVNHMPTHKRSPEQYPDRFLSDFLLPEGTERFRRALTRLKEGSPMEEVRYPAEELVDDVHPRRVMYRPVYINGRLRYISFQVVENT